LNTKLKYKVKIINKAEIGSMTINGGFDNDENIWEKCNCPKEYKEVIIVDCDDNSNTGVSSEYGEVTFDCVYQPNGTRRFK